MDDRTKCEVYTKLLNSLNKNGEFKGEISKSTYDNQLRLIKNDLVSRVQSDQKTAMLVLQVLVENNVHSIQSDLIDILCNQSLDQRLKNSIIESVRNYLRGLLRSGNVSDLVSLYVKWQSYDVQKFAATLKEASSDDKSNQHSKKFLFTILMPVILDTKNLDDPLKVTCIDLALEFASIIPITDLSDEEYTMFMASIENEHLKSISELRDNNFNYWHKLWMFLVRLLGKKLHHSMHLINKLLRVVEHAFRNSSYEQRLRGYDCWKELIDNVSLDSQHISSEKQIRLLLTPLRAKFSRQEAVIIKRFEVFVYLIEKLQGNAVLVLKEFLEFCYGEVGENTDPSKAGQGKSVPELWLRGAKVLLAILGHSHDTNECCVETDTDVYLIYPVLNSSNISNAYCHIINSIAECCKLLKDVEMDQHKNTVIKCFWRSLFSLILNDEVTEKDNCIKAIGKVLDNLLQESDPYCHRIASIIFQEAVILNKPGNLPLVLNNLEKFVNVVFSVPLGKESDYYVKKFLAMVCNLESDEETSKVATHFFNGFLKRKNLETNIDFIADIWIFVANKLEDYAKGNSLDFLVWPVLHSHQLTESVKEASIYEHYKRLVSTFVEKSDELHLALFKHFDKIMRNNPLLLKNVLNVITLFNPKTSNKRITSVTLEILAFMLLVPAITDNSSQQDTIELILIKLFETKVTKIQDPDLIKKLCSCVEHLLKLKHYDTLTFMEESLTDLPDNVKWLYGKSLTLDFLVDIFEKESDLKVTEKIHRIIELLRNVKNPESKKDITFIMPLGGRSAKIANLVKQIPLSPQKSASTPSNLRLFGTDVETHSPLKVVESQLKNAKTTPKKTQLSTPRQKKEEVTFIDDESQTKFVLIDSEVKVDKDKLTEHQKETLKKRREDIPALYQDLSQSASQSCDSNSVNAPKQTNEPGVFRKPNEIEVRYFKVEQDSSCSEKTEPLDDEKNENKIKLSEKEKKLKIKTELKKLAMNIVGAEDFAATRRSKRKRKEKKSENKLGPDKKRRRLVKIKKLPKLGVEKKKIITKTPDDKDNIKKKLSDVVDKTSEEPTSNQENSTDNDICSETVSESEIEMSKSTNTQYELFSDSLESKVIIDEEKRETPIDNVPTKSSVELERVIKENLEVVVQKEKKLSNIMSLALPETAEQVHKSRRKSMPTKKVAESKFFKSLTSGSFKKRSSLAKVKEDAQKVNLFADKPTKSRVFKQIEEDQGLSEQKDKGTEGLVKLLVQAPPKDNRLEMDESKDKSGETPNKLMENKSVPMEPCANGFGGGKKGKRLSSSEDDDIIESSQESSISNITATKIRLSVGKRYLVISDQKASSPKIPVGDPPKPIIIPGNAIKSLKQPNLSAEATNQIKSAKEMDPEMVKTNESSLVDQTSLPDNDQVHETNVTIDRRLSEESDCNSEATISETSLVVKRRRGRPKNPKKKLSPVKVPVDSEQSFIDNDVTRVEATPNNKLNSSGRKKNPAILEESPKTVKGEIYDKSQSLVSENKADLDNSEETLKQQGLSKPKKRGRPKKRLETPLDEPSEVKEKHLEEPRKRGRPKRTSSRNNSDSVLSSKIKDQDVSTTPKSVELDWLETTKKARRQSPRKQDNKEGIIKVIMDQVKKQVFSDKLMEPKNNTQSQDTQTQGTESLGIDAGEDQLQLELPQKPIFTESDLERARMDTASLVDLEDLKGFDVSSSNDGSRVDKTLLKNETAAFTESVVESTSVKVLEETEDIFKDQDQSSAPETREIIVNIDKLPESDQVIDSTEDVAISSNVPDRVIMDENAETEELVRQLAGRNIEVTMEVDHSTPERKQMPPSFIGSPSPLETSIPSSPITGDTPNRTSELLNNTSNISPIGSKSGSEKSSSDDEFVEERKMVPVALKFEREDADHDAHKQKSPEKGDDAPQKMGETSPEKAEKEVEIIPLGSSLKGDAKADGVTLVEKTSRFNWVKQGSPATHRFFSRRKAGLNMSPSASRIKKLMSNVKPSSQADYAEVLSQEDILTFTREVPSPLATPRTSILKRKHPDTPEEGFSPCAKRKRVNFSDPCTTSKKVFIKEDSGPSQCLFSLNSDDDIDKQFLEVLAANNIVETPQTESDNIETQPSLQVNNPLLLRDDVPIYPDLVDCEENVSVLSRKLTGPMFISALLNKFNSKDINTIGDLARQSEINIARLPFKTPMVANVYQALDNYYHKNFKSKDGADKAEVAAVNGEALPAGEPESVLPLSEVPQEKMDVTQELSQILERAMSENISSETLWPVILGSSDRKQVLAWVKTYFNLETRDILEEKDFSKVVKHITETVGLPKIFEILAESLESSEDESVYFDCMIKHSIEKRTLSSLIEKKSLQELQAAIWENVENEIYSRQDLLDACFLPFIRSIDLASFFNKLTIVEIGGIVVNRLSTEDYELFTKRIMERCSNPEEVRNNILENYSISELTSNIVKRGTQKEITSCFTYMFLAADKMNKEDLMQIFRLVSNSLVGELPPSKLMEMSIEFQKKIPIRD